MRKEEDPRADLIWGTIPNLLDDVVSNNGTTEALIDGSLRWTYRDLGEHAKKFAKAMMACGIEGGDRVAIWAPNSAAFAECALGAMSIGAILVTINTRFKGTEASYVIRTSGAKLVFLTSSFLGVDYLALLRGCDLGDVQELVDLSSNQSDGDQSDGDQSDGDQSVVANHDPISGKPGICATLVGTWLKLGEQITDATWSKAKSGVKPFDVSDLLFTSGTTGRPKGVMTTHAQSLRTFGTWASIVGLEAGDRYLIVNPFFHTFGLKAGLLACLMTRAVAIPMASFVVEDAFGLIQDEKISVLPGPPTLYQTLLDHPRRGDFDLSSLRLGVTGAAVVPVELVRALGQVLGFDTVLTAYGLTESSGTVTMCRRGDVPELVAKTSGRPLPTIEVQVVGRDGSQVPNGTPGEVVVRGYTVMQGYFGDVQESSPVISADGWLHTGDIGVISDDGYLAITDRLKDMFVVGGFNAYPAEIEAKISTYPGISALGVVGVPDLRLGEVGCAFVVRAKDASLSDEDFGRQLLKWVRGEMANYKVPRYVVIVGDLPRNASGKVLKNVLRDSFSKVTPIQGEKESP